MIGTSLGPYDIVDRLGAGGMGEVYLATDRRLDRRVAIKVLPPEVAADGDRRARFEQEARAAAALNHPHIAVVHDIGCERPEGADEEVHFIVQEFLEGETLRDALDASSLSLKKMLQLAGEIGEGLAAAHRAGVVHRDLKPDNIFVTTDGHAKILDFGLAKLEYGAADAGAADVPAPDLADSPTVVGTMAGQLLGTAGYMAPEQVRGEPADERSDVFAFGCVLYEGVAGRRAFGGEHVHATLARTLDAHPALPTSLFEDMPARVDWVLDKCLAKDPDERYQSVRDLVVDLRALATDAGAATPRPRPGESVGRPVGSSGLSPFIVALIAAVALAVGALAASSFRPDSVSDPVARVGFELPAPETVSLFYDNAVAVSADGRVVVLTIDRLDPAALGADSNESLRLFRRDLDAGSEGPIEGTEGSRSPAVSPDGSEVAFQRGSELWKLPIDGGTPVSLGELTGEVLGIDWSEPETIVFATDAGVIRRVDAVTGEQSVLVELAEGELARSPQLLPGLDAVMYTVRPPRAVWDEAQVRVTGTDGSTRVLFDGGVDARLLSSGHLVYARGTNLWVRRFDPSSVSVGDEEVATGQRVARDLYRNYGFGNGEAHFAVSSNGTLVFVAGETDPFRRHMLYTRVGNALSSLAQGPGVDEPRLSPAGDRLVVEVETIDGFQARICDLPRCDWTVLDVNGADPVWSVDGEWVYYAVNALIEGRTAGLYRRRADFSREPELLAEAGDHLQTPDSVAADGSVYYTALSFEDDADTVWVLPPGGGAGRLLDEPSMIPTLHPAGRWVAYVDPQGEGLYVRELVAGEPGRRTTIDSLGYEPRWSPDGSALYYRRAQNLMSVPFEDGRLGEPTVAIMNFRTAGITNGRSNYDVMEDGRVVNGVSAANEERVAQLGVVVNWFTELERLMPER